MTPNFPFFRFPMYYNSYRNPYNFRNNSMFPGSDSQSYKKYDDNVVKNGSQVQRLPVSSDSANNEQSRKIGTDSSRSSDEQFFDIFGIRLYFDDILILCLLFFLYQEEVNDQFLFIALLLLLLS